MTTSEPASTNAAAGSNYPVVITVFQSKGGVGKTTFSRLLAIYGAREDLLNKRVLLLDFDTQGSISKLSLPMNVSDDGVEPPIHPEFDPAADEDWSGRSSSADLFFDGYAVPYPIQFPYPIENLGILPAHKSWLKRVEEQDRGVIRDKVINRLFEFLSLEDVRDHFDIVVIDTGPKDSPLVRAAIRAATHMVIPIVMEHQCMDGLNEMLGMWRLELASRPSHRPVKMSGLVVNQFDARYATHHGYLAQLQNDERIAPLVLDAIFPRRAAVVDRDSRGAPAGCTFDLPKSADIRDRSLRLCSSIYSEIFPAEADRLGALEPDPKYAIAAREREAARIESEPEGTQA